MKRNIFFIWFFIPVIIILLMLVRGNLGNPTSEELNTSIWKEAGPFELSPERGRFSLTYSIVEDKSFSLSIPLAKFVLPDLGFIDGKYFPLFAPGVSILVIPGYLLGRFFDLSQVGSFFVVGLTAVLNGYFIIKICEKIGIDRIISTIAATLFLFATPAFSYSLTLYQHHFTTLFILIGIYKLVSSENHASNLAFVMFFYGLSFFIDYPNVILLLPIVIYALSKLIETKKDNGGVRITFSIGKLPAFFTIIPVLILFLTFNQVVYGSFFRISATLADVHQIAEDNSVVLYRDYYQKSNLGNDQKTAIGFFNTRNLINSLHILLLSSDRGVLIYAPIVLIGFLALKKKKRTNDKYYPLFLSLIGINLVLYSLWADPWGGWAFGARYLIPAYAVMSIFLAMSLQQNKNRLSFIICFVILMVYSVSVNMLGAVTTDSNPPKSEAYNLSYISGKQEKYTFMRNFDLMKIGVTKSYFFNTYLQNRVPLETFYLLLDFIIIFPAMFMLFHLYKISNEDLIKKRELDIHRLSAAIEINKNRDIKL